MNHWLVESVEAPPTVEFKKKAAQTSPTGGARYDMSQAVPSTPTPIALRRRLARQLTSDPDLSFYTDVPGLPELRARIASTHPLCDALGTDNIVITAGANHAMFTAFVLRFQAGDRVALLEPYYFNHDMALRMLGMTPSYCPLPAESGFALSASFVVERLAREAVKGVVLVRLCQIVFFVREERA